MAFWDKLAQYAAAAQPLADQLDSYNAQQTQNDVFAANPDFAAKLYAAKNNDAQTALQRYAQGRGVQPTADIQNNEYFNTLTPEGKIQFLKLKRADMQINQGNQILVRNPDGSIASTYAVGINPNNTPELAANKEAAVLGVQGALQPGIQGNIEASKTAADLNTRRQLEPGLNAANKTATDTAAAGVDATTKTNAAIKGLESVENALNQLRTASTGAPSGKLDNMAAGLANNYPGLSTDGMSKAAAAQGTFNAARGAAENTIRGAYRVAGSGAQTDSDAKPFIDMLPNANDSQQVKDAKINETMRLVRADIALKSQQRSGNSGIPAQQVTSQSFDPNQPPSDTKLNVKRIRFDAQGNMIQ